MYFREAIISDLNELMRLENNIFNFDLISYRQMSRFLKSEHCTIHICEDKDHIIGYILTLFHKGTLLSRIYSLAVEKQYRGQGIAHQLISLSEKSSIEKGFTTIRLEVRQDNNAAINLYRRLGYSELTHLTYYYEDHADGIRMQKRLAFYGNKTLLSIPFYAQTTPFTCGAACLVMILSYFDKNIVLSRQLELKLWREATTIFMSAGHGGCSGHGLALSVAERGFDVELWCQSQSVPFIDSVRAQEKKEIITLVHDDFVSNLEKLNVKIINSIPCLQFLEECISRGFGILMLISTYRFNGNKEPHWIIISGMSEQFFFIHDPYIKDQRDITSSYHITVNKKMIMEIMSYGKQKLTSCLIIKK